MVLAAGFYYAPKNGDIDTEDIGFLTKALMSLKLF
jgi:hypothetical protein